MPIGKKEVRITNVYTVEAGHEASGKHDPTPNWRENQTPVEAAESFRLRIEAEAGTTLGEGNDPYNLIIQATCLTRPHAVGIGNLELTLAEAFGDGSWEYDASEEKYTKSWSLHFPTAALHNHPPGSPPPLRQHNQVDETWQFFVSLEHNPSGGGAHLFGCTAASERFRLLAGI